MSRPHSPSDANQNPVVAETTLERLVLSASTPQVEEIVELKRANEVLKAERDAAVARATKPYTDVTHANHDADRSVTSERHSDQMKTSMLINNYKMTAEHLKLSLAQAQQTEICDEHLKILENANAAVEAAFARLEQSTAQTHTQAQNTIQALPNGTEPQKAQGTLEAHGICDQRLAELKDKMNENSLKADERVLQIQKSLQSVTDENKGLRKQLQKTSETLEWYKAHSKRLVAQSGGTQSSQVATGIHASFPVQSQRGSVPAKTPTKRRRSSTECATPVERLNNYSTPRRSAFSGGRSPAPMTGSVGGEHRFPHHSMTPTRQSSNVHRYQHANMYPGPIQPYSQPQAQTQPPFPFFGSPQYHQYFMKFFEQTNLLRSNSGLPPASPEDVVPLFNDVIARRSHQQELHGVPYPGGGVPMLPNHPGAGTHPFSQGGNMQGRFYTPSLSPLAPFDLENPQSLTALPSLSSGQNGFQYQQMQHQFQGQSIYPQSGAQHNVQPSGLLNGFDYSSLPDISSIGDDAGDDGVGNADAGLA
ncbi:hypothetical protein C7974DRAFT_413755 [Boeremia exigua]|uniref:uncharacterized protein n=1 Tax=Boeremia exigua TaxID=749465 RepID=UPI001E8EA57F|nr:uncharacterized protein C7974DRAFT_413755 [Boeremia exigua]KAH6625225.1 hypothetical protein C7974DRAFT_413755 [Boeremia exigua]